MPVSQIMSFTATPPTTGETPTTFNTNAIACWTDLKDNIVPDLNTAFTQMNALETNVNEKEVSAVAASAASVAAGNFKGTWTNQLTSIGESWEYSGVIYGVLVAGTASPVTTPSNWFALTIAQSIKNTPSGGISATTVQGALNELDTEKAPKSAPSFTDSVTISGGLNLESSIVFEGATADTFETTLIVTDPTADRTIALPDASGTVAFLDSPSFTGTPTAPTAPNATNTTQVATTAFAYGVASKIDSGYQKLPSGLIIQWGNGATVVSGGIITLPIAFPNGHFVTIAVNSPQNGNAITNTYSHTLTNFYAISYTANTAVSIASNIKYIAIGY